MDDFKKVLITESTLDDIGDAIRQKNGEEDLYYPKEMPAAIRRIKTGEGGGSTVAVYPILSNGKHIANIVVDGERFEIYAPEQIEYTQGEGIEIKDGTIFVSESLRNSILDKVDKDTLNNALEVLNLEIAGKQDKLEPGENITIEGNVISATGGSGGSDVSITPLFDDGIKIATFEIDGEEGSLYAPQEYKEEGLIPVMTSNTTPSGVVTYSSQFTASYAAWMAFNGQQCNISNMQGGWLTYNTDTAPYIQYSWDEPKKFSKLFLETANNGATASKTVTIEGLTDAGAWENCLADGDSLSIEFTRGQFNEYEIELNNKEYSAIRLSGNEQWFWISGTACTISRMQVYSISGMRQESNISDVYDEQKIYNIGDYCLYDNQLYICNSDGTTGAWNEAKWATRKITDLIKKNTDDISLLRNNLKAIVIPMFSYSIGSTFKITGLEPDMNYVMIGIPTFHNYSSFTYATLLNGNFRSDEEGNGVFQSTRLYKADGTPNVTSGMVDFYLVFIPRK